MLIQILDYVVLPLFVAQSWSKYDRADKISIRNHITTSAISCIGTNLVRELVSQSAFHTFEKFTLVNKIAFAVFLPTFLQV